MLPDWPADEEDRLVGNWDPGQGLQGDDGPDVTERQLGDWHIGVTKVWNGVVVGTDSEATVACARGLMKGEFWSCGG